MIRRPALSLIPIAAFSLLAACGDDATQEEGDERTASGEVLEGTISDAMLPVETLKSQPPLAVSSPSTSDGGETSDGSAGNEAVDNGDAAPADGETAPSPAGPAEDPAD